MSEMCDRFEILVSTWIDDELDRPEAIEMLDHLVRCRACRSFYRDTRALEGAVQSAVSEPFADTPAAPDDLWARIENGAQPAPKRRLGVWALRAAAVAIVGLALAFVVAPRVELENETVVAAVDRDEIEIELGSRPGEMTEDRFLEIATEVLEADRRYQRAMFRVMDTVMEDRAGTEGGGDELRTRSTSERPSESVGGRA